MSRYKVIHSKLIVEKPDKTTRTPEVILYLDSATDTVGVKFVGESILRGFAFDIYRTEINRLFSEGLPMEEVPSESFLENGG